MKPEEQSTECGLKKFVVHFTIKLRVYYLSFLSSNLTSLKIWKKNMINLTKKYHKAKRTPVRSSGTIAFCWTDVTTIHMHLNLGKSWLAFICMLLKKKRYKKFLYNVMTTVRVIRIDVCMPCSSYLCEHFLSRYYPYIFKRLNVFRIVMVLLTKDWFRWAHWSTWPPCFYCPNLFSSKVFATMATWRKDFPTLFVTHLVEFKSTEQRSISIFRHFYFPK